MTSDPTTPSQPGAPIPRSPTPPPPLSPSPSTPPPRQRAVLDSAHVGDIQGAFGTIREGEAAHRGWRSRGLALLAIIGPGLIVMVGDNDAGGVATYSQAGQNYGTSLLWVLLLLVPVLIVNQEMVVRLGAVTGVGHARLILERFGRFWGWFSVIDLFVLNFLTVVTEFIGVSLALGYFGVSDHVAVPIAAVALVAITATRQLPRVGAVDVRVRVREPARGPAVLPRRTRTAARWSTTSSCRGSRAARPRPRCC